MPQQIKGIPIAPLTGELDLRSSPDSLSPNALRFRQNFQAFNPKTVRRGFGWSKLFSKPSYNNTDFHDQLLTLTGTVREPVTMTAEVESSRHARVLMLGTRSRVLKLNQYSGNWQLLGSGFGGQAGTDASGPRFQCAVVGDYVTLTNGFDLPMYHLLGQRPNLDGYLMTPLPDLALIGLTQAKKTWVWRNCVFLANVVMDGVSSPHRLVWSDYNNPISYDPSINGSITGFQDLDIGEFILAGFECGNEFLIYTSKNIWLMFVNEGATPVFGFRKLPGVNDENCLAYENAIVNIGDGHVYMGKDRLYYFNQWVGVPDPLEWTYNSSAYLYDNISTLPCEVHVAGFCNNEAYFSVMSNASANGCPDVTLRLHKHFKMADTIDAGFTCFGNYRPQNVPSIRDLLIDLKICTPAALAAAGYGWVNEGLPNPLPTPSAAFTPTCIYTHQQQVVNGITMEDWNQPTAAPDSICALVSASPYANLMNYCAQCDAKAVLVSASSVDWCLKQMGDEFNPTFYRERCTNPSAVGTTSSLGYTASTGAYSLDGYDSVIRTRPLFSDEALVALSRVQANYLAAAQTPPSQIFLRVGISGQVSDPNDPNCPIRWFQLSPRALACLNRLQTDQQFSSKNAVPSQPLRWNFKYEGRYIFIELRISGTGGDVLLSGLIAEAESKETRNY